MYGLDVSSVFEIMAILPNTDIINRLTQITFHCEALIGFNLPILLYIIIHLDNDVYFYGLILCGNFIAEIIFHQEQQCVTRTCSRQDFRKTVFLHLPSFAYHINVIYITAQVFPE